MGSVHEQQALGETRLPSTKVEDYPPVDVLQRDVVVVGGGAAGTYTAIGLKDEGKTVALVEMQDRLGGHTHTYTDPKTGNKAELGVIVYEDLPIVHEFFDRFGIPLKKMVDWGGADGMVSKEVDFRTGKELPEYKVPDPGLGIMSYAMKVAEFPFLPVGFDLPDPVPEDLLIPFGEFVKKHGISEAVPTLFRYAQGQGDLLSQPTLYVMKYLASATLLALQNGFLTTERHDTSEVYQKATEELFDDALLNSKPVKIVRSDGEVKVVVQSSNGDTKLIQAKKLVITIPPKIENLWGVDLDESESGLFKQFTSSYYYTALIRDSGIPDNLTLNNVGTDTAYNLAALPAPYSIYSTSIPGLKAVKYGSSTPLSTEQVQQNILDELNRLKEGGVIATAPHPQSKPADLFTIYSSHSPYCLTVSPDAIRGGFYKKLAKLQGYRDTFYTGAAFEAQDSAFIWNYTKTKVFPDLFASLK